MAIWDCPYRRRALLPARAGKVNLEGLGKIGYVANSTYTVLGESMSAGRLYDKIGDKAEGKVVLVTERGVLCKVCKKSLAKQNGQAAD